MAHALRGATCWIWCYVRMDGVFLTNMRSFIHGYFTLCWQYIRDDRARASRLLIRMIKAIHIRKLDQCNEAVV